MAWFRAYRAGGLGLLVCRRYDFRSGPVIDDDIGVGYDVVGYFRILLWSHALPQEFIRAAFSPFHGAATLFSLGCYHWIFAAQLG